MNTDLNNLNTSINLSGLDPAIRQAIEALNARIVELAKTVIDQQQRIKQLEDQFVWGEDEEGGEAA